MNAILTFLAAILALFGVLRVAERERLRDQPGYFSPEYRARIASPEWRALRARVLATTLGRDLLFPLLRATQVDHIGYQRFGRERLWIDVVPLHPATHRLVTMSRDVGLRGPINSLLRAASVVWIVGYICLAVIVVIWVTGHDGAVLGLFSALFQRIA